MLWSLLFETFISDLGKKEWNFKKFATEKLKATEQCEKKKKNHITEWSDIKLVDDIQFNNYEVKHPGKHNPSFTVMDFELVISIQEGDLITIGIIDFLWKHH